MAHAYLSTGSVDSEWRPSVELTIRQLNGPKNLTEHFIVDTGFVGWLVLRSDLLPRLENPDDPAIWGNLETLQVEENPYTGTRRDVVEVSLAGRSWREVADFIGRWNLIGMKLLEGHRLTIDCRIGGEVLIEG